MMWYVVLGTWNSGGNYKGAMKMIRSKLKIVIDRFCASQLACGYGTVIVLNSMTYLMSIFAVPLI